MSVEDTSAIEEVDDYITDVSGEMMLGINMMSTDDMDDEDGIPMPKLEQLMADGCDEDDAGVEVDAIQLGQSLRDACIWV